MCSTTQRPTLEQRTCTTCEQQPRPRWQHPATTSQQPRWQTRTRRSTSTPQTRSRRAPRPQPDPAPAHKTPPDTRSTHVGARADLHKAHGLQLVVFMAASERNSMHAQHPWFSNLPLSSEDPDRVGQQLNGARPPAHPC